MQVEEAMMDHKAKDKVVEGEALVKRNTRNIPGAARLRR
jgi:hypothetical protein